MNRCNPKRLGPKRNKVECGANETSQAQQSVDLERLYIQEKEFVPSDQWREDCTGAVHKAPQSICLLFYGILTDTSCLLLPHILIQAILLLFSVGYFCFYAVSYFYGDLYKQSRPFKGIEEERRRRGSAFDRCSERVRLAKEKGVYSAPTLDATVQKKPEDGAESTVTLQKQPKKVAHVQWSTQNPSLAQVDETTTTPRSLEWATGKPITQSGSVDESRGQSPSRPSQQRRRSDTSRKNRAAPGASTQPLTSQTSMQTPIALSEMPSTSRAVPSERRSSRSDRRESSSPSPTRLTSERTGRRTRYSEPNANLATRKRNPRPPLQKFKSYEADDPNASPTSAIPPLLSQEAARRTIFTHQKSLNHCNTALINNQQVWKDVLKKEAVIAKWVFCMCDDDNFQL
ncbi:hypothetical protein TELCIR_02735 [Teladorsagia circumcincta]|uniref:Uncharacterized protein n=1 Tax=Teladorsagia circumcincta TaxID=45464 RepID=A0A2G9UYB4_TELCI|nr:hypothetical protein TELCIR_02735 [Teladorsagia circumcincta]